MLKRFFGGKGLLLNRRFELDFATGRKRNSPTRRTSSYSVDCSLLDGPALETISYTRSVIWEFASFLQLETKKSFYFSKSLKKPTVAGSDIDHYNWVLPTLTSDNFFSVPRAHLMRMNKMKLNISCLCVCCPIFNRAFICLENVPKMWSTVNLLKVITWITHFWNFLHCFLMRFSNNKHILRLLHISTIKWHWNHNDWHKNACARLG